MTQTISKIEEVVLTSFCCTLIENPGNLSNIINEEFWCDAPTVRLEQASKVLLSLLEAEDLGDAAGLLAESGNSVDRWVGNTLNEVLTLKDA